MHGQCDDILGLTAERNTHYWKQSLCRMPQALDKAQNTLGKRFVECNTRQIAHGIYSVSNVSLPSVFYQALGKHFAES